jgi:broad specificity phosphatase PhoE
MMKNLTMFLGIVLLAGCHHSKPIATPSQKELYNQVSAYYEQLRSEPIQFYPGDQVQQIILIRHGEPMLDKKSARSRKAMKQYIYAYDTARVHAFEKSPVYFKSGEIDTIYASPIVRASDTAKKLFGNQFVIMEDSVFREFERTVFPLPMIHLRPKTWGVLSRIPWIIGLQSRNVEGFSHAKRRARRDVLFLEQKAQENGRAVLVAHGFLNRYLKKYLIKNGWQLSHDGGKDYLSVQVLTKVVTK